MILFEMEGLVGLLLLGLWIYCILDVIATEESLMRSLPKGLWLVIVIVLPDVGSIAWLVLGRPERAGWRPGDTTRRKPFSTRFVVRGPDDDPNFTPWPPPGSPRSATPSSRPSAGPDDAKRAELERREQALKNKELEAWEADLARREAELDKKKGDGFEGPRW